MATAARDECLMSLAANTLFFSYRVLCYLLKQLMSVVVSVKFVNHCEIAGGNYRESVLLFWLNIKQNIAPFVYTPTKEKGRENKNISNNTFTRF